MKPSVTSAVWGPVWSAWQHRDLLARLIRRDLEARFRGSLLGNLWAVVLPLVMLGVYTFVFGFVIQPRWQEQATSGTAVALTYFSGLILFDFVFECIGRAPNLMREHVSYIKKIVFPVEILPWMVLFSSAVRLAIGSVLLVLFYLCFAGVPPPAALIIPVVLVGLAFYCIGVSWLLSAFGVYLRDIKHIITVLTPVAMFLTPVFFPVSAIPEPYRPVFYLNPMTFALEVTRAALFRGAWYEPHWYALYILGGLVFAWIGFRIFSALRAGFSDVL